MIAEDLNLQKPSRNLFPDFAFHSKYEELYLDFKIKMPISQSKAPSEKVEMDPRGQQRDTFRRRVSGFRRIRNHFDQGMPISFPESSIPLSSGTGNERISHDSYFIYDTL